MEMDLGSALIGITLILLCALPFVLIVRSANKRKKHMLQALKALAQEQQCTISKHELVGNNAIGLDESRNFLFFYHKTNGQLKEESIDLQAMQSCRLVNASRTLQRDGSPYIVVDRLSLNFVPRAEPRHERVLEFYNAEHNLQLSGELQSAESWARLLNDRLHHKK